MKKNMIPGSEYNSDSYFELLYKKIVANIKENRTKGNGELDRYSMAYDIIEKMSSIMDQKSCETKGHMKRVGKRAAFFGEILNLSKDEVCALEIAGNLHDIGKIMIPHEILHKPGKLTNMEFEVIKSHPLFSYNLLVHYDCDILKMAAEAALDHHENFDGTGYPYQKIGNAISFLGRIITIIDTFDALCEKRCYKEAWSNSEITDFFVLEKGKKFDSILADLLLNNIEAIRSIED